MNPINYDNIHMFRKLKTNRSLFLTVNSNSDEGKLIKIIKKTNKAFLEANFQRGFEMYKVDLFLHKNGFNLKKCDLISAVKLIIAGMLVYFKTINFLIIDVIKNNSGGRSNMENKIILHISVLPLNNVDIANNIEEYFLKNYIFFNINNLKVSRLHRGYKDIYSINNRYYCICDNADTALLREFLDRYQEDFNHESYFYIEGLFRFNAYNNFKNSKEINLLHIYMRVNGLYIWSNRIFKKTDNKIMFFSNAENFVASLVNLLPRFFAVEFPININIVNTLTSLFMNRDFILAIIKNTSFLLPVLHDFSDMEVKLTDGYYDLKRSEFIKNKKLAVKYFVDNTFQDILDNNIDILKLINSKSEKNKLLYISRYISAEKIILDDKIIADIGQSVDYKLVFNKMNNKEKFIIENKNFFWVKEKKIDNDSFMELFFSHKENLYIIKDYTNLLFLRTIYNFEYDKLLKIMILIKEKEKNEKL